MSDAIDLYILSVYICTHIICHVLNIIGRAHDDLNVTYAKGEFMRELDETKFISSNPLVLT